MTLPADLSVINAPHACAEISLMLAATVEPADILPPKAARHVEQCLSCQAILVRHRRIRRMMLAMADVAVVSHGDEVERLLEQFRPEATVHRIHETSRRKAYISGIAAAATAGAAGAIVIASRLSRTRLAS